MPLVMKELGRLGMTMLVLVVPVDDRMFLFLSLGLNRGHRRKMTLFYDDSGRRCKMNMKVDPTRRA
jgi:hypothetical protein